MISSFLVWLACTQDVSIIKRYEDQDTSIVEVSNEISPTNEPDAEYQQDLTKIVGISRYHLSQISCPACVGAASEFDIWAELLLHQPTSGNYFDHLQYINGCTTQLYDTHVSSQPITYSGNTIFLGGDQTIQLYPNGQGKWFVSGLYEYQYMRQTQYSINVGEITIPNAFQTVEGFDWIEPYTLLWVDPSYAFDAPIRRTGMTFTWSPIVPNTQFEVIIAVYSWDGSQFLGAVSCLENDSGAMFIPSTYLQSFSSGSLVAVHLIRHRMGSVVSPDLGGTLQSHMTWEVVGTGYIE